MLHAIGVRQSVLEILCSVSLPFPGANAHVNHFVIWSIFNGAGLVVVVGIV